MITEILVNPFAYLLYNHQTAKVMICTLDIENPLSRRTFFHSTQQFLNKHFIKMAVSCFYMVTIMKYDIYV